MTDIQYLAPRTLDEAISAFAAAGSAARILAGGTDLLVQMRSGAVKPGTTCRRVTVQTVKTSFSFSPPATSG